MLSEESDVFPLGGGSLNAIAPEAPTRYPGQDVPWWGGSQHHLLLLGLMLPCLNGMPLDHLKNLIFMQVLG